MINVNVITLEDNKEYIITDALTIDSNNYLIMAPRDYNIADDNMRIRKVIIKDGKEYLSQLESEEELLNVFNTFKNKYRKDGNNA